jgi:hypothetical protein
MILGQVEIAKRFFIDPQPRVLDNPTEGGGSHTRSVIPRVDSSDKLLYSFFTRKGGGPDFTKSTDQWREPSRVTDHCPELSDGITYPQYQTGTGSLRHVPEAVFLSLSIES